MGSIHNNSTYRVPKRLLGVLNKMGSIRIPPFGFALTSLLGVLNKMGSIPGNSWRINSSSLLGVLNKMGSIR